MERETRGGGVGGNGRGEVGAGYPPNTKNTNVFVFFIVGQRIATKHKKRTTNGAFFIFGRWEEGGETGRGCCRERKGARNPPNPKNANTFMFG